MIVGADRSLKLKFASAVKLPKPKAAWKTDSLPSLSRPVTDPSNPMKPNCAPSGTKPVKIAKIKLEKGFAMKVGTGGSVPKRIEPPILALSTAEMKDIESGSKQVDPSLKERIDTAAAGKC